MEVTDKQLIKIADSILTQLKLLRHHQQGEIHRLIHHVCQNLEMLERIRWGIEKCTCTNWNQAASRLILKTERIINELPPAINGLNQYIKAAKQKTPTLRQVYEELQQIQDEFDRLEYNPEENTLSVFTEPIELDYVFLGDFEIRLFGSLLADINSTDKLRIIALDPHPAASNNDVTHPHVSDEYLCAGDATVPMQIALLEGRICDYFMLARSVLETYNSSSAHVELNQWEGYPCYDCGLIIDEENSYCCESCSNDYCDDCAGYCRCCHTILCNNCLLSCPQCGESICESCMQMCSECNKLVCSSCIEDEICPSCREEREKQNDEESIETEPIPAKQQVA